MSTLRLAAILFLPLAASGCLTEPSVQDKGYSTCHLLSSAGWSAHVEQAVGLHTGQRNRRALIVTGRVTVPAGSSVSLALGPVEALDAPVQQILVRTAPPRDAAEQGPATVEASGSFWALKHYGAVTIRCGDGTLAIVKPVPEP